MAKPPKIDYSQDTAVMDAVNQARNSVKITVTPVDDSGEIDPVVLNAVNLAKGLAPTEITNQSPQYTRRQNLLQDTGKMLSAPLDQEDAGGDLLRRGVGGALMGVGGVAQGMESTMAGGAVKNVERIRQMMGGKGPTIQKGNIYEFGDIPRAMGAPEFVAAPAGLAMAALLDPAAIATRALGIGAAKGVGRGVSRHLAAMISENPEMADRLIADAGQATKPEYLDIGSIDKNSLNMVQKHIQPVYKEASELSEAALKKAAIQPASEQEVMSALDILYKDMNNAVGFEDEFKLNKMIGKLEKRIDTDKRYTPTVSDIVEVYRTLDKSKSPGIGKAAQELREMISQSRPYMKEANDKWALWRGVEDALEQGGIKHSVEGGTGKLLKFEKASLPEMDLSKGTSWNRAMYGWADNGEPGLVNLLSAAGQNPDDVAKTVLEIERSYTGRKIAEKPIQGFNPSVGLAFALAGNPLIGASVTGSRMLKSGVERNAPKLMRKLAEQGKMRTNILDVALDPFKDIKNAKSTLRTLRPDGSKTPVGLFMRDSMMKGTGLMASEGIGRAATMRQGVDQQQE